jgi:release factor glutamine methyltransferase
MAHALGIQRLDLYLQFDRPLGDEELETIRALLRRRGADEPVAYLVGKRDFYSLPFLVDKRVLVPRPETEQLVEVALKALHERESPTFCDVGTGSGCVAVALLHELPDARGVATDASQDALDVAGENAARNEVAERLELRCGDLLAGASGPFDALVSNPPYIVRGDESVQAGVAAHEPAAALYVEGDDPLAFVRRLVAEAPQVLTAGGLLAVEVGFGSAEDAAALFEGGGFCEVTRTKDLGGIERIVSGRRP